MSSNNNNTKKFTLSTDTDLHFDMLADHSKLKIMPNLVDKKPDMKINNNNDSDSDDDIVDNVNSDSLKFNNSSDEINFLRKQANLFGYSPDRIQESGNQRNVNLNCIPSKIHELFGDDFKLDKKITLEKINRIKEFDKYRKI